MKNRIMICSLMLFVIGLFMIYSASNIWSSYKLNDPYYYLIRQGIFGIVGIPIMFFVSRINLELVKKYAMHIFLFCLTLLVLVLIIGSVRGGARSWINLGFILIQPSEFMKLGLIILLSKLLELRQINSFKDLIVPMCFIGLVFILIMLEPDLGSGLVIILSVLIMLFVSKIKIKYFVYLGIVGVICGAILIMVAPYRIDRIEAYLNPWNDALGVGFQAIQSLYAIAPSGLFGLGYGNSRQKFYYLPEPQTDFIFSICIEELGMIGAIMIIIIFVTIVITGYQIAIKQENHFKMYLAIGITSLFMIQAFINLGVVTTLLPITGITLPFLSYGGSSLIINFVMMGLLMNIGDYKYNINKNNE